MSPNVDQEMRRFVALWRQEAARQGRPVPAWSDIDLELKARIGRRGFLTERRGDTLRIRFGGIEGERVSWRFSDVDDAYENYTPSERGILMDLHLRALAQPCAALAIRDLVLVQTTFHRPAGPPPTHNSCVMPLDKTPGERVFLLVVPILDGVTDPRFDYDAQVAAARLVETRLIDLGFGVPENPVRCWDIESGALRPPRKPQSGS